jgi:hypothetical protein
MLRMHGTIPPIPHTSLWHGTVFVICMKPYSAFPGIQSSGSRRTYQQQFPGALLVHSSAGKIFPE